MQTSWLNLYGHNTVINLMRRMPSGGNGRVSDSVPHVKDMYYVLISELT